MAKHQMPLGNRECSTLKFLQKQFTDFTLPKAETLINVASGLNPVEKSSLWGCGGPSHFPPALNLIAHSFLHNSCKKSQAPKSRFHKRC